MRRAPSWTTPADVLALLRRRWQAGTFLIALASGQVFEPLGVPLRGPAPGEMAARLGEVQAWAEQWQRPYRTPVRIEHARVGGRVIGSNAIPCRVWIDSYEELWSLLGVSRDVRRFTELAEATREECPQLVPWMTAHPMQVLGLEASWAKIFGTVRWIDEQQQPGTYLRQVDVPGVDTKFIEQHRGVLASLLDLQLDPARVDPDVPRPDFTGRYRFRKKPQYIRFRLPPAGISPGWGPSSELTVTEMSLRADEMMAIPPGITAAYVVENEITYLAFPAVEGALAIFGGGYAVSALESLGWLADVDLHYWGDIDTHGFAILNRLRRRFPHARSMLMDRETLLAHSGQWVTEPNPVDTRLDLLDPAEDALYRDLVSHALGQSVRLEQERVRFTALEEALHSQLALFRPGD
jgi:hypothetical protein